MKKRSSAFFANGITFNKFTGSRGKSGSNDATANNIAALRRTMDEAQVAYQFAELGRVDLGGGGNDRLYYGQLWNGSDRQRKWLY